MQKRQSILFRILGVAHVMVAIMLLPANLFLGFFTFTLVLPAQIWLIALGIRLWRPDARTQTVLRTTHLILAPFAFLLILYGFYAVSATPQGTSGGELLGTIGFILGTCSGSLTLWSLYVAKSARTEWPERSRESFSREKHEQTSIGIVQGKRQFAYIEVSVSKIADENRESYLSQTRAAAKVFKEHGALSVLECWGEDIDVFPTVLKSRENEKLVLLWIAWPSKNARNDGLKKIAADLRLRSEGDSLIKQTMIQGGFQVVYDA